MSDTTPAQNAALRWVAFWGTPSPGDPSIMKALHRKGLVEPVRPGNGRRVRIGGLMLTPAGESALRRLS